MTGENFQSGIRDNRARGSRWHTKPHRRLGIPKRKRRCYEHRRQFGCYRFYWLTSRPPSLAGDWWPLSFNPCRHCERVIGMSGPPGKSTTTASPRTEELTPLESPIAIPRVRRTSITDEPVFSPCGSPPQRSCGSGRMHCWMNHNYQAPSQVLPPPKDRSPPAAPSCRRVSPRRLSPLTARRQ